MWTVEEMVRLGMNRDAVEDFLGRACSKRFESFYPGLKCRRGHLRELRVVGESCRTSERVNSRCLTKDRLIKASQPFLLRLRHPLTPPRKHVL